MSVRTLARRHLVRYDAGQTATMCGLPVVYPHKWARLATLNVDKPDVVLGCNKCERTWNPDECAAEMVYEGVCA